MQTINEVRRTMGDKLSSDFEVLGNDWHADVAKQYLKELDHRQEELGIDKEKARAAVKAFWSGNFPEALNLIWGKKVAVDKSTSNTGYKTTITYTIAGWGTYTEVYEHKGGSTYLHKIDLSLERDPNPDYSLKSVFYCYVVRKGSDFVGQYREADAIAWRRGVSMIYNFLFVGFEGRDLTASIGKYHCHCKNKIS